MGFIFLLRLILWCYYHDDETKERFSYTWHMLIGTVEAFVASKEDLLRQ